MYVATLALSDPLPQQILRVLSVCRSFHSTNEGVWSMSNTICKVSAVRDP